MGGGKKFSKNFATTEEISHAASSPGEIGRYLAAAGDRTLAVELYTIYTLNSLISESLYIPLKMLEVTLRNRISRRDD